MKNKRKIQVYNKKEITAKINIVVTIIYYNNRKGLYLNHNNKQVFQKIVLQVLILLVMK